MDNQTTDARHMEESSDVISVGDDRAELMTAVEASTEQGLRASDDKAPMDDSYDGYGDVGVDVQRSVEIIDSEEGEGSSPIINTACEELLISVDVRDSDGGELVRGGGEMMKGRDVIGTSTGLSLTGGGNSCGAEERLEEEEKEKIADAVKEQRGPVLYDGAVKAGVNPMKTSTRPVDSDFTETPAATSNIAAALGAIHAPEKDKGNAQHEANYPQLPQTLTTTTPTQEATSAQTQAQDNLSSPRPNQPPIKPLTESQAPAARSTNPTKPINGRNPSTATRTRNQTTTPKTASEGPKGTQSNEVLMAELKAMKTASIQARNAALEAEIVAKKSQLEIVTSELKFPAQSTVKRHIRLLHDYNDIRDVGQGLVGMIADSRGVRIGELYAEFGVGRGD